MLELLLSLLILIGAGFTLIGSLGLLRLRDFYSRLHAPTKATTLGVGSLLIASAVFFSYQEEGLSLHEVLVTLFLFLFWLLRRKQVRFGLALLFGGSAAITLAYMGAMVASLEAFGSSAWLPLQTRPWATSPISAGDWPRPSATRLMKSA